jgi:membrane protein DedA with SNARE-associated domain
MNQLLLQLIEHLKYLGVFIGAFVEGPATALAAGFLVKSQFISFTPALIAHFMGDFLADMSYFSVGRMGNKKILSWIENLFHFSDKEVYSVKRHLNKNHLKIIFTGKLTHFLGLPAIIGIGLSDYPWKHFFFFNLVATIIKSIFLVSLGYSVGALWEKQESIISRAGIVIMLIALIVLVYYLVRRKKNENKI